MKLDALDLAAVGRAAFDAAVGEEPDDTWCDECGFDGGVILTRRGTDRDMGEALLRELELAGFEIRRAGA